jgi:ribosomal-protein-alanine N-acetyltransferase
MSVPRLNTDRLLLREIKSKDIFEYSELFSDQETMDLFGGPPISNDLEIKNTIIRLNREYEKGQSIFWVITLTNDKEFIGFIRLMSYNSFYFDASYEVMGDMKHGQEFLQYIDKDNGWEIDYALLKQYRRRGIMTEALVSVFGYCRQVGIKPVYAKVNSITNKSTIGVLKKNNFKELLPQANNKGELGMIYIWK